jgi:hypothetical protein
VQGTIGRSGPWVGKSLPHCFSDTFFVSKVVLWHLFHLEQIGVPGHA